MMGVEQVIDERADVEFVDALGWYDVNKGFVHPCVCTNGDSEVAVFLGNSSILWDGIFRGIHLICKFDS